MTYNNDIPVFVYGTLMKDQSASHYLDDAYFLGDAVLHGYSLYDLGWYPGIRPYGNGTVFGEVYLVSDELLGSMDRYEGEGSLYHRSLVPVDIKGKTMQVFAYVYAHEIDETQRMKGRWSR